MKLTPHDVQSLKDTTSTWAGFTYENEDGNIIGQGTMDVQMDARGPGGNSLN